MSRAAIFAAILFFCLPSSALASTAHVDSYFHSLSYAADPGEINDVQVSETAQTVTILDTGATITAGSGCNQVSPNEVSCSGVIDAVFRLGGLGDTAALLMRDSVYFNLLGGDGSDDLSLCSQCRGDLRGESGGDVLQAGDLGSLLTGGPGEDTLTGGAKFDDIGAGRGNDTIDGAGGNDLIEPGAGDDIVDGGSGRDQVIFAGGTARGGVVVDLMLGTATGQGMDTLVGIEDVLGTNGPDKIYGDAGANDFFGVGAADILVGRGGADLLSGGGRNDRLYGGPGNDQLLGDEHNRFLADFGRDLLIGGRGDDRLIGGPGKDRMKGWAGNDIFRARDGFRDVVGGGAGTDSARVDVGLDAVRNIETLF